MALNVYIDKEMFEGKTPRGQRGKLKALHGLDANIYICRGLGHQGAYHVKDCIVDRRIYFTGGANFTNKSERNRERVFRMTGEVVKEVLEDLSDDRRRGVLWDGI